MRPIPPTESITADVPDFTSGATKPVAFQPASNNRLFPTLALVVLVHVLIISFLLVQFGWPFGAHEDGKSNAVQAAIIIPVTLEASETEEPATTEPTTEQTTKSRADEETAADQKSENTSPQSTQPTINDSTQHALETTPETSNSNRPNTDPSTRKSTSTNTNNNTNTSTSTKAKNAPTQVHLNASKSGESGRPADNEGNLPLIAAQIDPNYLHRPNPIYPPLSKQRREEGTVLLRVSLDAQGIVREVAVERSSLFNRLDQAALEAVRQWRFIPARRGSATLPSSVIVPIEFKHQ